MAFISGVKCDVCGTILYFDSNLGKGSVARIAKKEGWRIVRKDGQRLEQAYCPGHRDHKEVRK